METPETSYPRPVVSVDLAIFGLTEAGLALLLTRRGAKPYAGKWALPGGWVHTDEDADLEAAARRVLKDKTGVETPYLEQLQTLGNARRDPRGWSVSVAYVALISADSVSLAERGNISDASWRLIDEVPGLAFDHSQILESALVRLRNKVEYSTLPVHLLPPRFTLGELQSVYERILGRKLDKSAFRKRVAEADFVEPVVGEMRRASNRPAQIYRVKPGLETVFFNRTI